MAPLMNGCHASLPGVPAGTSRVAPEERQPAVEHLRLLVADQPRQFGEVPHHGVDGVPSDSTRGLWCSRRISWARRRPVRPCPRQAARSPGHSGWLGPQPRAGTDVGVVLPGCPGKASGWPGTPLPGEEFLQPGGQPVDQMIVEAAPPHQVVRALGLHGTSLGNVVIPPGRSGLWPRRGGSSQVDPGHLQADQRRFRISLPAWRTCRPS